MLERKTVKYKFELTAVALANKLAWIVYALATKGGPLRGRGLNQQAQQERGFAIWRSASRTTAKRREPTERLGSPGKGQVP